MKHLDYNQTTFWVIAGIVLTILGIIPAVHYIIIDQLYNLVFPIFIIFVGTLTTALSLIEKE